MPTKTPLRLYLNSNGSVFLSFNNGRRSEDLIVIDLTLGQNGS